MAISRQLLIYKNGSMKVEHFSLRTPNTYHEVECPPIDYDWNTVEVGPDLIKRTFTLRGEVHGYGIYEEL